MLGRLGDECMRGPCPLRLSLLINSSGSGDQGLLLCDRVAQRWRARFRRNIIRACRGSEGEFQRPLVPAHPQSAEVANALPAAAQIAEWPGEPEEVRSRLRAPVLLWPSQEFPRRVQPLARLRAIPAETTACGSFLVASLVRTMHVDPWLPIGSAAWTRTRSVKLKYRAVRANGNRPKERGHREAPAK
jgi:hypothetical protein